MSAILTPAGGSLALGLATLERLLGSEDEKVALKAAELLLRWHPDVQKRKAVVVDAEQPEAAAPQADEPISPPPTPSAVIDAAKKVLLAPFNPPHRSTDPLPPAILKDAKTLNSFLSPPKSAKDAPG
jgi:hypothetical protein